jgi:hypothetical protein
MGIAFLVLLKSWPLRKCARASLRCPERQGCLKRKRTPSFYEREAGDIPAGLAPPMARALGVSVDELLGETEKKRRAAVGPTGRMRRLFEAASKLPRSQQEKIAAVIEAFVNQHSDRET